MDFSESIKSIFKSSKSAIEKNNGTILLSHFGEMKPDVISEISEKTESKLFELKTAKKNYFGLFTTKNEPWKKIKMSNTELMTKPDMKISVNQTFGFESEMEVNAFSKKNCLLTKTFYQILRNKKMQAWT